jgi:hypothetical protein
MNNHSELLTLAGEIKQLSASMEAARETLKSEVVSFLSGVIGELKKLNETLGEIEQGHRPSWMDGCNYYQNVPGPLVMPKVE